MEPGVVISLLGLGINIAILLVGWGKFIEKLNGLGGRVDALEKEDAARSGRETQTMLAIERVVQAQANLIQQMGRLEKAHENCDDNTRSFAIELGSKIDALMKQIHESEVNTAREIASINATLSNHFRGGQK